MRDRYEYMAALSRIPADDVASYLSAGGWLPQEQIGRSTLWVLTDASHDYEALVPRTSELRDYSLRMSDLVQLLVKVENRSRSQIVRDLTTTRVDRQYIRTYPVTPPGTIPVSDAHSAIEGVRQMMIAGAYAVDGQPQLVLPRRKARKVETFPKAARLGLPEEGSYILSVEIPLDSDEEALFETGPPFGRRVLLRLYDAIRAARDAASETLETSELSPFTDRVGEGVSTTLCRALAHFGGTDEDRPFEMRFSWALAMPTGIQTPPLHFDEQFASVFAQAGEDLDDTEVPEEGEAAVTGKVWRTERISAAEPGWVVVRGITTMRKGERRRLVWILLEPEDFSEALRAADRGLTVRVTGDLVRTGQRAELRNPGRLSVIDG